MNTAVNGSRAIPGELLKMGNDFWKEWAESQAALARIEERWNYLSAALLRIEKSEAETAKKSAELEKRLGEMSARFDAIEGKGIAAWSTKKVAQLAALVSVLAVIFAGVFAAANWLIAHYK